MVIPVLDRNIAFGIGQDITERLRVEEALQESEPGQGTCVRAILPIVEQD